MNRYEGFSERQQEIFSKIDRYGTDGITKSDVMELVGFLNTEDSRLQDVTSDALVSVASDGDFGDEVVSSLLSFIENESNTGRQAAVKIIGAIVVESSSAYVDSDEVEALGNYLGEDDWEIRTAVLYTIRKIGAHYPESVTSTGCMENITLLLEGKNPIVRQEAAKSLGIIGVKNASLVEEVGGVVNIISSLEDPDSAVRWNAAEAVRMICISHPTLVKEETVINSLTNHMHDENGNVQREVLRTLGCICTTTPSILTSGETLNELVALITEEGGQNKAIASIVILAIESEFQPSIIEQAQQIIRTHLQEEKEPRHVLEFIRQLSRVDPTIISSFHEEIENYSDVPDDELQRTAQEILDNSSLDR